MGTYNLPRDVKGEGRILFIFSPKSLLYTCGAGAIGLIFFLIFKSLNMGFVGLIVTLVFALIGFIIGTFKIPNSNGMELMKKTGGESIEGRTRKTMKE